MRFTSMMGEQYLVKPKGMAPEIFWKLLFVRRNKASWWQLKAIECAITLQQKTN